MGEPVRIQRKRTKGWKMPANTVCVCRPGPWGNPFPVDHEATHMHCLSLDLDPNDKRDRHEAAVDLFRTWMTDGKVNELVFLMLPYPGNKPSDRKIKRDLGGKNLACWCALGSPCHADVLLELANERARGQQ